MSLSDELQAAAEPAWTDATDHEFTRRLAADTLSDDAFRWYLVQDYRFVESLASVVGYAAAQAPTMTAKRELAGFLGVITADEDDYFARSFDALDVPSEQRTDPEFAPVTQRFDDLLHRAVHEGGYAETLAVLVPVEWVYLTWATAAAAKPAPDRFYLAEWIDLHENPGFENTVSWLRSQLDEAGEDLSDRRRKRVERLFCRAVDYEVAFFDAALEVGSE